LAKALTLVKKMLWTLVDAEATEIFPHDPESKIPNLVETLFSLLIIAREPSIRHCYMAFRMREEHDISSGSRQGKLQFPTADGREIDLEFSSSYG
jgi:hypothetical protein